MSNPAPVGCWRLAELLRPQAAQRKAQAPGQPQGTKVSCSNLEQETPTGRTRKLAAANTGYSASTLDEIARGTGRQRNELAGAEYSAPAVSHEEVRRDSAGVTFVTPNGAALGVSDMTVRRDSSGATNVAPDGAALGVDEKTIRRDRGAANAAPDGAALGVSKDTIHRESSGVPYGTPDGAALGVSVGTVQADRGVQNRTPDSADAPARVTGLDGKSYPAKVTTTTRQTEATKVEHLTDAAARPGTTPYTRPCERV